MVVSKGIHLQTHGKGETHELNRGCRCSQRLGPRSWCAVGPVALTLAVLANVGPVWGASERVAAPSAGIPAVTVKEDPHWGGLTYSAGQEGCELRWIVYKTDTNRGVVKQDARCREGIGRQLSLVSAILEEVLKDPENAREFRTLFWGRLAIEADPMGMEMSYRIARAAHLSSQWDKGKGRPKTGHENRFVKDLADQADIYRELKEIFGRQGRKVRLSSVEKVLIPRADQLPFFERLKGDGVKPKEKLPYDCMTWFSVSTP